MSSYCLKLCVIVQKQITPNGCDMTANSLQMHFYMTVIFSSICNHSNLHLGFVLQPVLMSLYYTAK